MYTGLLLALRIRKTLESLIELSRVAAGEVDARSFVVQIRATEAFESIFLSCKDAKALCANASALRDACLAKKEVGPYLCIKTQDLPLDANF